MSDFDFDRQQREAIDAYRFGTAHHAPHQGHRSGLTPTTLAIGLAAIALVATPVAYLVGSGALRFGCDDACKRAEWRESINDLHRATNALRESKGLPPL